MSRSFAISLKSPQAALRLPVSEGKKMEIVAKKTWLFLMIGFTVFFIGTYLYQVNRAASKSFVLQGLDRDVKQLQVTVADLENTAAKKQALAHVEERLRDMGYVSVDRMEFVDVPRGYALAQ